MRCKNSLLGASYALALTSLGFAACGTQNSTSKAPESAAGASDCSDGDCDVIARTPGTLPAPPGGVAGAGGLSASPVECVSAPAPEASQVAAPEVNGAAAQVHINHLGYDSRGSKRAVVESDAPLRRFQLLLGDAVVFDGALEDVGPFSSWGGEAHHLVADFSAYRGSGQGYYLLVNGERSEEFEIAEHLLFSRTGSDVLSFFQLSRADDAPVWAADQSVSFVGAPGSRDVRGGWYDASGDISKYLSHLSYANFVNPQQIPLTAWALAWASESADDSFASASWREAAAAEARFGADYLVRAQDPAGFFYINVFDGWSGTLSDRRICAFEKDGAKTSDFQAAFREGGGVSIAALARVARLDKSGDFSPADYLAAAEKGFAHLQQMGPSYCDDGKENIIDDYTALLAALELYETTSNETYLSAARGRADALHGRLTPIGYFVADDAQRPFWHASDAGLPVLALTRYAELEPDASRSAQALKVVSQHLDYLLTVTDEVNNPYGYARQDFISGGAAKSGFFIPHDNETGYWWQGESARLASLAAAALLGGRATGRVGCELGVDGELARYATDQLDWILGKNPFDASMMAGYGRNNPEVYCSVKNGVHGHHQGGISNGITGRGGDGSEIQWGYKGSGECWENWRWIEQWLPHATWYLIAVTAMSQSD